MVFNYFHFARYSGRIFCLFLSHSIRRKNIFEYTFVYHYSSNNFNLVSIEIITSLDCCGCMKEITLPKRQSTKEISPAKNELSHNWPDNREREQPGQSDCWRGAAHDGKWTLIRGVHVYYTSRQLWRSSIMPGWRPGPRPYGKITDRPCFSWMPQHRRGDVNVISWFSYKSTQYIFKYSMRFFNFCNFIRTFFKIVLHFPIYFS